MDLEAAVLAAALVEADLAEATEVASEAVLTEADLVEVITAPEVSTEDLVDLIIADRALDTVIIIARASLDGGDLATMDMVADALAVSWGL